MSFHTAKIALAGQQKSNSDTTVINHHLISAFCWLDRHYSYCLFTFYFEFDYGYFDLLIIISYN